MNLNTVQNQIKETFEYFNHTDYTDCESVPLTTVKRCETLTVEEAVAQAVDFNKDNASLFNLVVACACQIAVAKQKTTTEILNEVKEIVLKKNQDYGSSFLVPLVFLPDESPELTILVRLSDKVERYVNLKSNRVINVVDESIEDTLKDIIGYCVLLVVARQYQGSNRAGEDT